MRTLSEICEREYFWRNIRITSEETRKQYRIALRCFGRHLEREPTTDDLDDDTITIWMSRLVAKDLAIVTVRERVGRVIALWTWLAKRGQVPRFPTVIKPQPPEPLPQALTESQLRALFASAARERGTIDRIPAGLWWQSFFAFVFSTGERKSAARALRIGWLDLESGIVRIPPAARKGKRKWGIYNIWPETAKLLSAVIEIAPNRELVWPWPFDEGTYYNRFSRILRDAGIPDGRKFKTHCLRVSHATWLKILGGNATKSLGHDSAETTDRHYIDPTKLPEEARKLFVPWG